MRGSWQSGVPFPLIPAMIAIVGLGHAVGERELGEIIAQTTR